MMFLQYAIWGAWSPDFSAYLEKIGLSGAQAGVIYGLVPVGCMLAPFAAGQLADRYCSTEKLLAAFHLLGSVLLLVAARLTHYDQLWMVMLGWAVLYAPTLALTNSICFHHLPEAKKEFSLVRVWGTIGWITSGWMLSLWLRRWMPDWLGGLGGFDGLWLAGVFSLGLGVFSFFLPHTPPRKAGGRLWTFLSAIKLLRDPQFAVFIVILSVVATEMMFYYLLAAPFLKSVGLAAGQVPFWMTLAQIAEIGVMLMLPTMLARWGMRKTMCLGLLAWPVRYAIFALGSPLWLVVAALTLHGVCYVCFFTVSYIYVNQIAPADIKASAQGLLTFIALGVSLFIGSNFAGYVKDTCTVSGTVNYTKVFLVPLVLTLICAVAFMIGFRERSWKTQAQVAT